MDFITLEQFTAEIESSFSSYADTNDIDRLTIKTIVIDQLRKFGKNICDKRETIINIKNSRALLPHGFKSMIVGLKLEDKYQIKKNEDKRLISEKQYISNPAQWDGIQRDYVVNYCDTKIVTEKLFVNNEYQEKYYDYEWLSLVKGMKKDSLDVNCLNMHPSVRDSYSNKISITNRTLNTNFKEGKIYLQYNSLPSDEDGEIVIPIISTGDIVKYIKNTVKLDIAETIIINSKNAQGLSQLVSVWMQNDRKLEILAKSEANWSGLSNNWGDKYRLKNRQNQEKYTLPK